MCGTDALQKQFKMLHLMNSGTSASQMSPTFEFGAVLLMCTFKETREHPLALIWRNASSLAILMVTRAGNSSTHSQDVLLSLKELTLMRETSLHSNHTPRSSQLHPTLSTLSSLHQLRSQMIWIPTHQFQALWMKKKKALTRIIWIKGGMTILQLLQLHQQSLLNMIHMIQINTKIQLPQFTLLRLQLILDLTNNLLHWSRLFQTLKMTFHLCSDTHREHIY